MNRVKELRIEQRKTQQHLANVAGVKRQAIGKYEKQKSTPRGDVLVRLAVEFGVSPSYLVGEPVPRTRADRLSPEWEKAVEEWIAIGLTPSDVQQAVRAWRVARGEEEQRPDG